MEVFSACKRRLAAVVDRLLSADHLFLVSMVSLLLLAFCTPGSPLLAALVNWTPDTFLRFVTPAGAIIALGVIGAVYRPLLRKPVYWFYLTVLLGGIVAAHWCLMDNHKYLMTYWCLALGFVFAVPPELRRKVLTTNALALLGLCMLFATGWKALSPSFRNGGYFQSAFLVDERFQYVACLGGGAPVEVLAGNREQRRIVVYGHTEGTPAEEVRLYGTPRLHYLAVVSAWWTILIEGSLAILCLWPLIRGDTPGIARWRNGLLLVFLYTTYAAANIVDYGLTLAVLGLAQAPADSRKLRAAYLGAFALIPLYTIMNVPEVRAMVL